MQEQLTTEVINTMVNYCKDAFLIIQDDIVIFDTSDGEYGPVKFPLEVLKQKIKEHEENNIKF